MTCQRGLAGSVQWAILTPVTLLIVLGTVQVGLWQYGRVVASHAAIAAAEEAAHLGASPTDARALGSGIATRGGLVGVEVRLTVGADDARAVVSGRMPVFFDLGQTRVSEQATRPREQVSRP